ncbi:MULTISPECIES: DUF3768 domain-containing protein [unclassified Sphingomonas]|jgi:hypothetical protein|uniref:DUF3768 domain-containing protein n=1 Tax=unclassified Sphingomonas TaxID=196159 RepID=UPI0002E6D6D0|nr:MULTISPECIES: DUF3768 domain-containing protein [unclassified Sphingomonas]KTF67882.1 hypothetical protein ATB93_16320 [Sphingomonas sp. WG]
MTADTVSRTEPINTETVSRTARIAALSDRCRHGLDRNARHMITQNLRATLDQNGPVHGLLATSRLVKAIREYQFTADDGPERDFGAFDFDGHRVCFKVDCYEPSMEWGAEDPSDASATVRVMTIMLTSDY